MHRRARHLNPGSAGAVLALDSRFITGLSDGDPVSTWNDRSGSGNNATQSGAARPTFETNEQGGQPVIEYDGSNDYFSFDRSGMTSGTFISVLNRTGSSNYQSVIQVRQIATARAALEAGLNNDANYGPIIVGSNGNGTPYAKGGSLQVGIPRVLTGQWLGGGTSGADYYAAWDAGIAVGLTNSGNVGAAAIDGASILGAADSLGSVVSYFRGWMGIVIVIENAILNPLRRRLEHAAAFSFKIPCS